MRRSSQQARPQAASLRGSRRASASHSARRSFAAAAMHHSCDRAERQAGLPDDVARRGALLQARGAAMGGMRRSTVDIGAAHRGLQGAPCHSP